MKRISPLQLIIILILASAILDVSLCNIASAQSNPVSPVISIINPTQSQGIGSFPGFVTLTYETNTALSWIGYSIDGGSNVTVSRNDTLVTSIGGLGYHTLSLYGNNTSGNWATPQTVTYLVVYATDATPSASPTLSPSSSSPSPETTTPYSSQPISQPTESPKSTSNPTQIPAIPEFPLTILPLFASMLFVSVILRHRKTANLSK